MLIIFRLLRIVPNIQVRDVLMAFGGGGGGSGMEFFFSSFGCTRIPLVKKNVNVNANLMSNTGNACAITRARGS